MVTRSTARSTAGRAASWWRRPGPATRTPTSSALRSTRWPRASRWPWRAGPAPAPWVRSMRSLGAGPPGSVRASSWRARSRRSRRASRSRSASVPGSGSRGSGRSWQTRPDAPRCRRSHGADAHAILATSLIPRRTHVTNGMTPAKRELNHRLETISWGLFLIMLGGFALLPSVKEGTWLIGAGVIMLGLNAVRLALGIRTSGFTVILGTVALLSGIGSVYGVDIPVGPLLIILIGLAIIVRALDRSR